MIYIQFDILFLFNTYDDFLFISMWSSTTLDIARMICAIILLTIICNVFVILFVYFFVGSGAAATFIPCPFSHGYRGCVWMCDQWMGEQPSCITDPPLDL